MKQRSSARSRASQQDWGHILLGYFGLKIGIMENRMETTGIIRGYIGIIWGLYIGILENKMETTIMGYIGYLLGLY